MAKKDDTLSRLVAGGATFPLPSLPTCGEVSSEHVVYSSMSKDGRYLRQVIIRITDMDSVKSLTMEKQFRQQANCIRSLFAQYIDFKRREEFCDRLTELLTANKIEWQVNAKGDCYINIPKGSGQSEFFRLLLHYMTPQKLNTLHDKEGFKSLRQALRMNVRQFGQVLNNNSLGVTLHRIIDKL